MSRIGPGRVRISNLRARPQVPFFRRVGRGPNTIFTNYWLNVYFPVTRIAISLLSIFQGLSSIMRICLKFTRAALVALALMAVFPAAAFAYIDPGTGSFLVQGILAAVVGVGVALKMFWHRIVTLFGGKPPAEDDDSDD